MKLVMTLKVRDEEDILEANLRYHLAQGVDFFIVTDNGSVDGTRDILRRYRDAGLLELIEEPSDALESLGGKWITRMTRMAKTDFDADWVINDDADEFWWPLVGTLKEALASVPQPYEVVVAPRPEFVARPDGPGSFAERLVFREARSRLREKVALRAAHDIRVGRGGHHVKLDAPRAARESGRAVLRSLAPERGTPDAGRLIPAPRWPLRILHFPVRSYDQFKRRVEVALFHGAFRGDSRRRELLEHYRNGTLEEVYSRLVFDDSEIEAGLEEGRLVEDHGLRDFLAGCPDPLADGGIDAARRWAAQASRLHPERQRAELAANELDAMQAMDRTTRSLQRKRFRARHRARRLKRERRELRGRLGEAQHDREQLAHRLSALEASRWGRLRALVSRMLRRA